MLRGKKKVTIEFGLLALAQNLRKKALATESRLHKEQ